MPARGPNVLFACVGSRGSVASSAARHPGSAMVCLRSCSSCRPQRPSGTLEPDPIALFIAFVLLETLPLAVRRYWPRAVFAITLGAALGNTLLTDSPALPVGVVVALYTVAAHCDRRTALRAALATALLVPALFISPEGGDGAPLVLPAALLLVIGWALGDNLRTRRAYLRELESRAARRAARAERAPGRRRRAGANRARAPRRDRAQRQRHGGAGGGCGRRLRLSAREGARGPRLDRAHRPRGAHRAAQAARGECADRGRQDPAARSRPPPRPAQPGSRGGARGRPHDRRRAPGAADRNRPLRLPDRPGGAHQHAQTRGRATRKSYCGTPTRSSRSTCSATGAARPPTATRARA